MKKTGKQFFFQMRLHCLLKRPQVIDIDEKKLNDMLYNIKKCLNNMLRKFHPDIQSRRHKVSTGGGGRITTGGTDSVESKAPTPKF